MHITHIRKYCGLTDGETVSKDVLDLSDRTAANYEVAEKLVDIDQKNGEMWLRVQWDG